MTGPALEGVFERIPSEAWFDTFVSNEAELLSWKDPYTLLINEQSYNEYTHYTHLDSTDLYNIKDYIKGYPNYVF